jgi:hypothetical protein
MIRGIQELYRSRCFEAGALDEHLPLLYMLSINSEGVAEFGIDRGRSTSAILAGQETRVKMGLPAFYHGHDIRPECRTELERLAMLCEVPIPWEFTQASSTDIPPVQPVDLLFIDSLHTEEHIKQELAIHLPSVRKCVAMHDTVSFGENGELPGTRGILYGLGALLKPEWLKVYDSPRNHGFAVFQRRPSAPQK